MNDRTKTIRVRRWHRLRIPCAIAITISIVTSWPLLESLASALDIVLQIPRFVLIRQDSTEQRVPPASQTRNVQRIRIDPHRAVEFTFDESIVAAIVVDPEIVAAAIQSERGLLLTGLKLGYTILIVLGRSHRVTYAIDVVRSAATNRIAGSKIGQTTEESQSVSGSQGFYFTPGTGGGPSLLRYTFDYRQQLHNNRTLRTTGELLRFFGGGDRGLTVPLATTFGANRLTLGLDSRTTRLDLLDSQLEISRIGLNGYTLRGPHFISTSNSRWGGLEFFAGNARPQLSIFSHGDGRLAGVSVPVWRSDVFQLRARAVWIAPARHDPLRNAGSRTQSTGNGFVWQTEARYSPDENTNASGELAYSKGRLSSRARLDIRRDPFMFSGEVLHLDRHSPMIAIGAQAEGRTSSSFNLQWRPGARFNAGASYTRINSASPLGSARAELNSRMFLVKTNFQPTRSSHFGFTLNDQRITMPASTLVPLALNLETRSTVIKWDQRLGRGWTNNLEARVIFSREMNTQLQTNRGFTFREQLRYNWRRGSAAGFVSFRSNTPSLEGLVLRNPALLPAEFRAAFTADPQSFLLRNRDVLPLLLNGVELPVTRDTASGVNFQVSHGRSSFAGEVVYSTGTFASMPQRNLQVTMSGNLRLDAANSLQATVSRVLAFSGSGTQTAFTVGYVHRFGSGSGGGFQFSKLFGIGRGRIQGRVFMDFNSNGQQDSDEKGLAGIKIQLDGMKTVTTDARGDFKFDSLEPGDFEIALISAELGVTLRASKAMPHRVSISPRETVNLTFGLTNSGFVAGRVFNDLFLTRQYTAGDAPGLKGVSLKLYSVEGAPFSQTTESNGDYDFRNLPPGKYVLAVDPDTLPENFGVPSKMSWDLTLGSLQSFYLDIPVAAHRAISGIVYIDNDNDGHFDPRKDSVVGGARIVAGNAEAVSTRDGLYLLRNLPAGELNVQVYSPAGKPVARIRLELGPEPTLRTGMNLKIKALP
jgi:hypothetical protein